MNHSRMRRAGTVAATLLLVTASPAWAENPAGVASAGSAEFTKGGQSIVVPTLARCAVEGPISSTSAAVAKSGIKFGAGASSCTTTVVDPDTDRTETLSVATGADFELSALVTAGGPRLRVGKWKVTCKATDSGTSASWALDAASGFRDLPATIPANYVHEVKRLDGTVLAEVTFNEVALPQPNDGSVALSMMHFRFKPESGVTGEVVVGATACSPTP